MRSLFRRRFVDAASVLFAGVLLNVAVFQSLKASPEKLALLAAVAIAAEALQRVDDELLPDALEMLADDIELRIRQKMMDVGNAAGDRILDWDHGELRRTSLHRGKRVLEGRAWQRRHVRVGVATGQMRVGAWLALEGDFVG